MQSRVPIAKYKDVRASKQMAKMIISAKRKVLDETNLQIDILFNAAAIVLYRYHGWKDDQIMTFFKAAEEVGQDCSEDYEISLIEMLWNETGIELMAEGCEKRWFQVSFLNSEMDIDRLAIDQYSMLQFYRQQLPWVPAQITAAILLSLYRVEGWKDSACKKFLDQLEDTKYEYDKDPEKLRAISLEEAGVKLSEEFWHVES